VLYCGRFSEEKGTVELIQAYKLVSSPKKALVLVGDGRLRGRMEALMDDDDHSSIYFMGFHNRNKIGKFYALADMLVLPSQKDTWGMVVNEGLCFSLPVVVSDQVGAGADLVIHEKNGYVFHTGDIKELSERISKLIELPEEDRRKMGDESWRLITEWSNRDLPSAFVEIFGSIGPEITMGKAGLLLRSYRVLPGWTAQMIAFSLIGILWGAATGFLFFRPVLRRLRGMLERS
jgi:glycosyltransferase involved in cell wall biosynthesis